MEGRRLRQRGRGRDAPLDPFDGGRGGSCDGEDGICDLQRSRDVGRGGGAGVGRWCKKGLDESCIEEF
jgi:hypothetical protein